MEQQDADNAGHHTTDSCLKKVLACFNGRFQHCVEGDNSSDSRAMALALLMLCCTCGTPVTLLFTIPAYALADRGEVKRSQDDRRQAYNYRLASYACDILAIIVGIILFFVMMFLLLKYLHEQH